MLLALDDMPVSLSSILINVLALFFRFVDDAWHIYQSLCMDLVGGLLAASCNFRQLSG